MLKVLQLKIAVGSGLVGEGHFGDIEPFAQFIEGWEPIDKEGGKNPDQAVDHGFKSINQARHFLIGTVGKADDDEGHGGDAGPARHADEDQDLHDDDQAQEKEQGVGEGVFPEPQALEGQEQEAIAEETRHNGANDPVDGGFPGALEVVLEAEEGDDGCRAGSAGIAEVLNKDAEGDGQAGLDNSHTGRVKEEDPEEFALRNRGCRSWSGLLTAFHTASRRAGLIFTSLGSSQPLSVFDLVLF